MPVLPIDCHLPTQYTTHTIKLQWWTNNKRNKGYKQLIYIYISHVNVTQTVPDISPLMPMHQDPWLVYTTHGELQERVFLASLSLRWRHNERIGVLNQQSHGCLLNRLFRRRSEKTWTLRVAGLRAGNSPVTGEFNGDRWIPRTKGQ